MMKRRGGPWLGDGGILSGIVSFGEPDTSYG
jgi:hypothetical protein